MESIVWCEQSYSIKDFLLKYSVPQIVQVHDGYYGTTDDNTLSHGQIISLHQVVRVDKVKISVPIEKNLEKTIYVPLNCPERVEILPKGCSERYSNMRELLRDSPAFVRAIHHTPWLRLKPGDTLKLQEVSKDGRRNYAVLEFCDESRGKIRIPLDYEIAFEALAATHSFVLNEVVRIFQLPVRVRFTQHGSGVLGMNKATKISQLEGGVLLKQVCQEDAIIATSREENFTTVLNIPADLDITVKPAIGAVVGSKDYALLVRSIHESAKIDALGDLNKVRDEELGVEKLSDYEEVAPLVPPRRLLKATHASVAESTTRAVAGEDTKEKIEKSHDGLDRTEDTKFECKVPQRAAQAFTSPWRRFDEPEDIYDDLEVSDLLQGKAEELGNQVVSVWSKGYPVSIEDQWKEPDEEGKKELVNTCSQRYRPSFNDSQKEGSGAMERELLSRFSQRYSPSFRDHQEELNGKRRSLLPRGFPPATPVRTTSLRDDSLDQQ